jgi:hypothetical protein
MIKYGAGSASGVALALATAAGPSSASMASPVQVTAPGTGLPGRRARPASSVGYAALAALSRGTWKYCDRMTNRATSIRITPKPTIPITAHLCDHGAV